MPSPPEYFRGQFAIQAGAHHRIMHFQRDLPDHIAVVNLREEKCPDILGTKYWADFHVRGIPQQCHVWAIDMVFPEEALLTKIRIFA